MWRQRLGLKIGPHSEVVENGGVTLAGPLTMPLARDIIQSRCHASSNPTIFS